MFTDEGFRPGEAGPEPFIRDHSSVRRRRSAPWRFAAVALLGMTPRAEAPIDRSPWRRAAPSGYEAPVDAVNPLQFGRAYQLPPFGRGNGVEALFWTPLARVSADRVDSVLDALAQQDIASWAAAVRGSGADSLHDVWASSARIDSAQDLLMALLRT